MRRVKIVAIAKDEGAYLPEWIFHHLYFGFSHIDIYINRTSDNSTKIIDSIHEKFPNVRWLTADWVDRLGVHVISNAIQYITYAQAYYYNSQDNLADYIYFTDLDEFWIPLDFVSTINDCLDMFPDKDGVYFEWAYVDFQFGERQGLLLEHPIGYNITNLGKTCVRTGIEECYLRLHKPSFANESLVLADGVAFEPDPEESAQHVAKRLSSLKQFFILHDVYKTTIDFFALLIKNTADYIHEGKAHPIKYNRGNPFGQKKSTHQIRPPQWFLNDYKNKFNDFINMCDLSNPIREARLYIFKRALKALKVLESNKDDERVQIVTKGLDLNEMRLYIQNKLKLFCA